mmetsp:Transcript_149924/g.260538  ORF Transcript_149924/g.260538 Transcript_149924/m.260538 type:complete len:230 (-) Transcript_149924:554-1243(-)
MGFGSSGFGSSAAAAGSVTGGSAAAGSGTGSGTGSGSGGGGASSSRCLKFASAPVLKPSSSALAVSKSPLIFLSSGRKFLTFFFFSASTLAPSASAALAASRAALLTAAFSLAAVVAASFPSTTVARSTLPGVSFSDSATNSAFFAATVSSNCFSTILSKVPRSAGGLVSTPSTVPSIEASSENSLPTEYIILKSFLPSLPVIAASFDFTMSSVSREDNFIMPASVAAI